MENNITPDSPVGRDADHAAPSPENALDQLNELRTDREHLAAKLAPSPWLSSGFGAVAACYIALSLSDSIQIRTSGLVVLFACALWLAVIFRTATGFTVRTSGARFWMLFLGLIVLLNVLYSIASAVVSLELPWWVIAPAIAAAVATTWVSTAIVDSVRENIRHGH